MKNDHSCYCDQYDSFPTEGGSLNELKAWMYYEYGRESRTLLRLTEEHFKSSEYPLFDLKAISEPFARIVACMKKASTLRKSWIELSSKERKRFTSAISVPPVRFADEKEILSTVGDDPLTLWGLEIDGRIPFGSDEQLRLIPLLVDAQLSKSEILTSINEFLDKELKIDGRRGRGARSKERLAASLRDLAVLRALSNRNIEKAKLVTASQKANLFPKSGAERSRMAQILNAKKTFKMIFPGLINHPDARLEEDMISYSIYKKHHKQGGSRGLAQKDILSKTFK